MQGHESKVEVGGGHVRARQNSEVPQRLYIAGRPPSRDTRALTRAGKHVSKTCENRRCNHGASLGCVVIMGMGDYKSLAPAAKSLHFPLWIISNGRDVGHFAVPVPGFELEDPSTSACALFPFQPRRCASCFVTSVDTCFHHDGESCCSSSFLTSTNRQFSN